MKTQFLKYINNKKINMKQENKTDTFSGLNQQFLRLVEGRKLF